MRVVDMCVWCDISSTNFSSLDQMFDDSEVGHFSCNYLKMVRMDNVKSIDHAFQR
jgi:hypothetical protein